jgi:hypothetical protein
MTAKKRASRRSLGSDLKRVDAHVIKRHEYDDAPELTDEMLSRMVVKKRGRVFGEPRSELMIEIRQLRWPTTQPRVSQLNR